MRRRSFFRPLTLLIVACAIIYGLALCTFTQRAHAQMATFCTQQAISTSGFTTKVQIIPAATTGSAQIYICGYTVSAVAASVVTFQAGTGTNCGTTSANIGPKIQLGATSTFGDVSNNWRGFLVPTVITAGVVTPQALCVTASAAADMVVYYAYGN
jgi:hypothetical protein